MSRPLLCIGGYDPSGGAGVIADLRAARAAGCGALAVVSTLTAQSSGAVRGARKVPRGWIRAQIAALEEETRFGAVKTGLLADPAAIREVASWYRRSGAGPLLVDPVLAAGDGTPFMSAAARAALVGHLLPLAALVTPNRGEAEILSGVPVRDLRGMERAARRIAGLGAAAVMVKGGHMPGGPVDLLYDGRVYLLGGAQRLRGRWHGLGCHLAAAIGARLATGDPLVRAVRLGRACLARGMRRPTLTPSGRLVACWDPREKG